MSSFTKIVFITGLLILLMGTELQAQSLADSTWPMFLHDTYHTGLSPLIGDMDTCYNFWQYETDWPISSSPALGDIDNDGNLEVVIGAYDGNLYALNAEDGSFLWSYETNGSIRSSPVLGDIDGDDSLEAVFMSDVCTVYAVNGEDGSFLWSYITPGNRVISPSAALGDIDGDGLLEVVIGGGDYRLYALNGEDGSVLWSYQTCALIFANAAFGDIDNDENIEVVVGSGDYIVYALNGEDMGRLEESTVARSNDYSRTILRGPLVLPKDKNCRVFDITGRVVIPEKIKPGIYFIEIDGVVTQKVVKVR